MNSPNAMPEQAAREWRDILAVAACSAVLFVFAHFQAFTNPYVINDDVRQQVFWMQQWQDPGLYPSDLLTEYARHYVPWGVQGFYRAASEVMSPFLFSKILTGLLFVFFALCLYRTGRFIGGQEGAWFTVAVFWLMPWFLDNLSGGLSRAFAGPLLALFFLCWLERAPWALGVTLVLQALFIPYICILCALASVMAWGAWVLGRAQPPPFLSRSSHFVLLLAAAVLVYAMNSSMDRAGFGPLVTAADMVGHPEYGVQGRYWVYPGPSIFRDLVVEPWEYVALFHEGGTAAGIVSVVLLAIALLLGAVRVRWSSLKRIAAPVLFLCGASLILYILAKVFLLRLFIPSRYLMYTVNLLYCLGFAVCLRELWRWISPAGRLLPVVLAVVLVLAGIRLKGVALYDYSADRELYSAIQRTPKDALIAGHPATMDNVLTFGRRKVLASFELAHPWCKGYWGKMKPRLEDLFKAYYASDPETVIAFCARYGIDFLAVDDRHYESSFIAGHPFFAPFDELIRNVAGDRRSFALLSSECFHAAVIGKHYRLIDMRELRRGTARVPKAPLT